jgi:hypothetical protein
LIFLIICSKYLALPHQAGMPVFTGKWLIMFIDAVERPATSEASWLVTLLETGLPTQLADLANSGIYSRLRQVPFEELVLAAAAVGPDGGRAGVIDLYRSWIACQGSSTPHLFAAWFNLGAELAKCRKCIRRYTCLPKHSCLEARLCAGSNKSRRNSGVLSAS